MVRDARLSQRGQVRQDRRALGIRDRNSAQLALFDVLGNQRQRDMQDLGMSCDGCGHRGRAALEWHVHHIEPERKLE